MESQHEKIFDNLRTTVGFIIKHDYINILNTKYFPCWGCYMDEKNNGVYEHSGKILFSNISKTETDSGIQLNGYKYITNKTCKPIIVPLSNKATIHLFQDPYLFNTILQDIRSWSNGFNDNETMNGSSLKEKLSGKKQKRTTTYFDSMLPCWACYKQKGNNQEEIYSGLVVLASIHINQLKNVEIIGFNHTAEGMFGYGSNGDEKTGGFRIALGDNDEIRFFKNASEFAETLKDLKKELTSASTSTLSTSTYLGRILRF